MRITHGMIADAALRNLNAHLERMDKLQDQLTSGRKIRAPSDDPIGAAAALDLRGTIDEIEQFIRNGDSAKTWLEASDAAMDSALQTLQRARELAVQGSSDALATGDRQMMADEVVQLIDQAIAVGNSNLSGQYLFAGFKVRAAPFALAAGGASVTYSGDSGEMARSIDASASVVANLPGDEAFDQVFSSLISLRDALRSDNVSTVSATITSLDAAMDSVLSSRAKIGARVNRLTDQSDRLEALKVNVAALLSEIQDVDMTEAITEFTEQQTAYEAALAAAARAMQPSLLEELR